MTIRRAPQWGHRNFGAWFESLSEFIGDEPTRLRRLSRRRSRVPRFFTACASARAGARTPHPSLPQRLDDAGRTASPASRSCPTLHRRPLAPRQGRLGIHMDYRCRWRRRGVFNGALTVAEKSDWSFSVVSVSGRFALVTLLGDTSAPAVPAARCDTQRSLVCWAWGGNLVRSPSVKHLLPNLLGAHSAVLAHPH